jgi:hypothetical protein
MYNNTSVVSGLMPEKGFDSIVTWYVSANYNIHNSTGPDGKSFSNGSDTYVYSDYISRDWGGSWTSGVEDNSLTVKTGSARDSVDHSIEITKVKNIYDMSGNMYERTTTGDPNGTTGNIRGGSWMDASISLIAPQFYFPLTSINGNVGFRVALYLK